ncbi:MAG: hypothetical protein COW24_03570 [Candidatus Kerfeldbacteria bacterium CG15_BIG_FIL_POST_REV_8_21_14_020_45_12]|uniref:Serine aminopeptidase S33 domain-containing protein n=1 Tax=Candidatus Kerfeldbacteria bacterium CG15_BIG_FIL_POST_REV_8_21_14_020_45_12 TaxID=2014247 RepID=A0A2M7H3C7_9BACT|nr:MAG: hypothetical protein COW24_03570 [Candidatus Kerfeldbacteria bacterium CG15_BIG_FIL_POST_REV_8_21_14_020_45_12]PJA93748.1 MAG: hypothetical protein CO132_01765 [Candidatus Kerfeldbacteria bacterium CG_4_9_14_3_um_filter_45_8]
MVKIERCIIKAEVPIVGVLAVPDAADSVIVLAHGFRSSKDGYTSRGLEAALTEVGFATFRFDFFGHGESGGNFSEITLSRAMDNLEAVIMYLKEREFSQMGLFGSSFGGMVTTLVAASHPEVFAIVLKSPVSDYVKKEQDRLGKTGLQLWQKTGSVNRADAGEPPQLLNYGFYEDSLKHDGYLAAAKVQSPVRIIHGDTDDVVPIEQSRQAAIVFPEAELIELPNVTHDYRGPGQFDKMVELTVDWFSRQRGGETTSS